MAVKQVFGGLTCYTIIIALVMQYMPIQQALQPRFLIPELSFSEESGGSYDDLAPVASAEFGPRKFPLLIKPLPEAQPFETAAEFSTWLQEQEEWLLEKLHTHGGILFRGFAVDTPRDFELVSLALEPNLDKIYLGTSPRKLAPNCTFVHTASEFPGWRIIPAHCEMSFKQDPPNRIFFFAHQPNTGAGGETPLIDFRQVYLDMDKEVLRRFEEKKVRYIRKYFDKRVGTFDPLKSKSWQEMFNTEDVEEVFAKCKEEGFEPTWENPENPGHGWLGLVHVMEPTRTHPVTGDKVWHNHLSVLHVDASAAEYAFSAQHLDSWMYVALHYQSRLVAFLQRLLMGTEGLGQHVTHTGGEQILDSDVDHVRSLVWKHTRAAQHQKGDVVMLDNRRLGHARQPYSGPRSILTTWH